MAAVAGQTSTCRENPVNTAVFEMPNWHFKGRSIYGESDFSALLHLTLVLFIHQFAQGLEDQLEVLAVFRLLAQDFGFKLSEATSHVDRGNGRVTQANKYPHHLDVHCYCSSAAQNARKHHDSVFGERIRLGSPSTAAAFDGTFI